MNEEIKKLNKGIILNTIKTDSLGYITDKKIILPKNEIHQTLYGKFKEEIKIKDGVKNVTDVFYDLKKVTLKEIPYPQAQPSPMINEYVENNYDKEKIIDLLKSHLSFIIYGRPGYGKTWILHNIIIPFLKGKKIFIASTTKNNRDDLNEKSKKLGFSDVAGTIQFLINRLSMSELDELFLDCEYLIIDEASQLTQEIYKVLEYIKTNTKAKIILIGDPNQCKGTDAYNESWIKTKYVKTLCDCNIITLKKHDKIRYDDALDNLITIIENSNNIAEIINNVKKTIKATSKVTNNINLAYFNKTCEKVKKDYKKECYTVHSYQGRTIDEPYSILNLDYMSKELIYTAISRATQLKNISLIKK
jgi:ATP-dependent exoDNAse (exonuclease V) alpha subunit